MIVGIDYGAKLAGTTVIASLYNNTIRVIQSKKKQNADKMIMDFVLDLKPKIIAIDAPLSLPPGVLNKEGSYFYRHCDTALKAMSPMFIGGLTARAMKLMHQLNHNGIKVIETYPKMQALRLKLEKYGYKNKEGDIGQCFYEICKELNADIELINEIDSWHKIDGLLALIGGIRYTKGHHISIGNEDGYIIY